MSDPHTFIGGPLDGQVKLMSGARWLECPVLAGYGGFAIARYERRTVWEGVTPRYEYVFEDPEVTAEYHRLMRKLVGPI